MTDGIATSQDVPVVNPRGEIVTIPQDQLIDARNQGYVQATPEQVSQQISHDKYGGVGEQIKTGLEGAASAATFGASTGLEKLAGVKSEDIEGRAKENPGSHVLGQVAGLAGSALIPGVGAANLLEHAGVAGADALGLGGSEALLAKVGSSAVKQGIETGLFQAGDEASKMFASDKPINAEAVQTAVTNVGLSGLIGGGLGAGIGAVSPLFKAGQDKLGGLLKGIIDHVNGAVPEASIVDGISPMSAAPLEQEVAKPTISQSLFQKMKDRLPVSPLGLVGLIISPKAAVAGFLMDALSSAAGKDLGEAGKIGLMKFLGSSQAIEPEGFKAMTDFIQNTIKGETLTSKAANAVFDAGKDVLPSRAIPDDYQINKLDKNLKELQKNPSPLFDMGGKTAHYLPEHGTMMAQTAGNAVQYLNSLRPNNHPQNPLDEKIEPSTFQSENFNNALKIAEQPLTVLKDVKDGTVTPENIAHLHALYPDLYEKLIHKVADNMIQHKADGGSVPYKTRLSVSLFLGQPLDSTMTPSSIQAMQPQNAQAQPQFQNAGAQHGSMKNINKLAENYQTPQQARQAEKISS